ncbi:nitrogenase component 1 [uncultured Methanofollis sp.]|uniref:nitrogenase component 1 n=1 Tax=uncultured Methanofollis sp. TaxID=262500 RepID=UPI00262A138D|nr:nitrogenase component 1 [uncultured Methanofollis sp.]
MNLKTSPSSSRRYEGCTLTGALSVTTAVEDAVTIVHGPAGCAHHNFSLLHAVMADQGRLHLPPVVSTDLGERDVIFGGEEALERTVRRVVDGGAAAVFVLTTCIAGTIGDDVASVCAADFGVPVVPVPTSGFLGGVFTDGLHAALLALAGGAERAPAPAGTVTIVGEKNLEFEVEENYSEVKRLLATLGVGVGLRFVREVRSADLGRVGAGRLNILREPALVPVGEALKERFGTPYVSSFPIGMEGSITFLRDVGSALGVPSDDAVAAEEERQEEMIASFADIRGAAFSPGSMTLHAVEYAPVRRVMEALDLKADTGGAGLALPYSPPVGTAGVRRLLHRWRRQIHA